MADTTEHRGRARGKAKKIEWRVTGSGCWECTSHKISDNGYPVISRSPRRFGFRGMNLHRYLYEQLFGCVDLRTVIRHNCDNKLCINPEHLLAGTQAENIADKVIRGRTAHGETHGCSKLNEQQVNFIRVNPQISQRRMADMLNVSQSLIGMIRTNRIWRHLP